MFGIPLRVLVLFAFGITTTWNLYVRSGIIMQHRTEVGGVEHNVVYGIQKVLLGLTLYEDPERPPFDAMQYTPAYYVVGAAIGGILGIEGDDARAVFLLNRSLALAFNLLMALFVVRSCLAGGAPPWAALVAAAVSLCCLWEQFFGRMDAMALALSVAAVHYFLVWLQREERRSLVISCVLAVLGAFSKQSGVALMLALPLHLFLLRQYAPFRLALITMSLAVAIGACGTLLLGTPHSIYQNTVLALRAGSTWDLFRELFEPAFYKYMIGWHALAIIIVVAAWRSKDNILRFLGLIISVSLVFGMVTGFKIGSRLNYFQESLTFTFIGGAILLSRMDPTGRRTLLAWSFAGYAFVFATFRTKSTQAWHDRGEPDPVHRQLMLDDMAVRDVLRDDMHLAPDDMVFITYREYLEHFLIGQSALSQKDIVHFADRRMFDYADLHEAMRDGRIRFVITDSFSGTFSILDSTYSGWKPVRQVKSRWILARNDQQ